ncbi:hypothetical protein ACJMK2_040846 [Sinanodonta woodiana]|uniref:Uncharacterized protein n=1 Tax=Sinanodonta woodiana TaxID=1069815 RepID=A0ABD3W298_SINWO
MAEYDADQSVLIVGYEKPWLDRSAILIDNSFVDDIDEPDSKVNHSSDHENLADEGEQELKQLKESQVKSQISACLASSREKSQHSQDQHEYNQSSTKVSRESSRKSQESDLSGRSARGPDGKRTSKDTKSRSNGERKGQLTNENPQKSSKKQEETRQRSSVKTNKRTGSDMER